MSSLRETARNVASASWIRWAITAVILGAAAWFALKNRGTITNGWRTFLGADFGWVLISLAANAISLYAMAEVMRVLLRSADVRRATRRSTNALVLASNAWSVSVPGGVAFSTALQVRRMLQWGATPVVVSWFVVFSGALSTLGLVALAIGSLFFIGQAPAPATLIAAGVAVLLLTALLWWVSRNTAAIESIAAPILRAVNRVRRMPSDAGRAKLKSSIRQLTEVELSAYKMATVFTWSFLNWVLDVVCLYAAMRAIGVDDVSASAILLAFVSGKVAGLIQATPGGVGPIEAVLTGTLVAAGMVGTDAVATVLIYRLVSFILPALAGWVIYLVGFTDERRRAAAGATGDDGDDRDDRDDRDEGTDAADGADGDESARDAAERDHGMRDGARRDGEGMGARRHGLSSGEEPPRTIG